MTGPTHILVGFSIAVVAGRVFDHSPTSVELCLLLIGSLAPDIDADSGSITRPGRLLGRFVSRSAARVLDELGQTVGRLAQALSGHRGLFHWPILPLCMVLAGWWWSHPLLVWFAIGYLGHIFADSCTVAGIPLLAPFWQRSISFSPIRTGSALEGLLAMVLSLFMVTFGWELLPQQTRQGFRDLGRIVEKNIEHKARK